MRTASNQARKHWGGLQLGTTFLQLSVLDLHATLGLSCFWSLQQLFFRMHVADPLMMHCGMGSVRSTSRRVAFDVWPRVVAWRWQSDAASLEFHRLDIHRTSVNRWELRFAAARMASKNAWYRIAQEKLYRPKESNHIDSVFRFAQHLDRGASTNTVVSRRTKVHKCETMSMFFCAGLRQEDDVDGRAQECLTEEHPGGFRTR